jgi:hypothetical protein
MVQKIMSNQKTIPTDKSTDPEFSLNGYFGKDVFEKAGELFEYLNKPVFKHNKTGVSHRNLNWWISEKVLEKKIDEINRFTFTEFVWIKMAEQMRLFNIPLPYLANLKGKLFETIKLKGLQTKKEQAKEYIEKLELKAKEKEKLLSLLNPEINTDKQNDGVNILQLLIIECILNRKPLSLAFFANGSYLIIDKSKEHLYSVNDLNLLSGLHYVNISISKILSEFLRSDLAFVVLPKIRLLTYPENKLYEVLGSGDYESIAVHFKDGDMESLDIKKNAAAQKKMIDILSEGSFAEIVVKKNKGVVVKIEQNSKIAF